MRRKRKTKDNFEFAFKGIRETDGEDAIIEVDFSGAVTFDRLRILSKFATLFMEEDETTITVNCYNGNIYNGYLRVYKSMKTDIFFNSNGYSFTVYK